MVHWWRFTGDDRYSRGSTGMFGMSPVQGRAVEHTSGQLRVLPLQLDSHKRGVTGTSDPIAWNGLHRSGFSVRSDAQTLVSGWGLSSKLRHQIQSFL
jgi:hypothetical protein